MGRKKANGSVFGNSAILEVQKQGSMAWSDNADRLVRQIADVLVEHAADQSKLTTREVADLLNDRGVKTAHGNSWDKSRLVQPLRKARALISADERRRMESAPTFGMF